VRIHNTEDYLGAIYRLRSSAEQPLPLIHLKKYFGYSPISIHEMITKLEVVNLVQYIPYKGVILTPRGEIIGSALVRRHRIWERFLTDMLQIPWDTAHEIAGQLEHAAPEMVTEKLSSFLGNPERCPHGDEIPEIDPTVRNETDNIENPSFPLDQAHDSDAYAVVLISPEITDYLEKMKNMGIFPGRIIKLVNTHSNQVTLKISGKEWMITNELAHTIWVKRKPSMKRSNVQ
jgi:DtxR family transcriptional regulator, Mn-dependent transcriptional regulator